MSLILQLLGAETVTGAIDRKVKKVPRAVRNAVRRGATRFARAEKANLKRKRTGLLAKAIGSKVVEKFGSKARATGLAGVRRGFRTRITKKDAKRLEGVRETRRGSKKILLKNARGVKEGDVISATRYAHLIENGHKKGKGRSAAPPYPFMRPAFQSEGPAVKQDIRDAMVQEILRG